MNKCIKYKVLFVDDDSFLRTMYGMKLKEAGFDVATLEDANGDFVEKVASIKPDLVYLDIVMPGRFGFEALELLKADSRTKEIPVIFETNLSEVKDIEKGISLVAVDYLVIAYLTPSEFIQTCVDYFNDSSAYIKRYPIYLKRKA